MPLTCIPLLLLNLPLKLKLSILVGMDNLSSIQSGSFRLVHNKEGCHTPPYFLHRSENVWFFEGIKLS